MTIKQLKTLLAVVEHNSFARAGDQLGLSHSAVSLHIKAMEEELGVQLFDRIKRPPVPTARGRALADHARRTLAMFEASAAVARGDLVRRKLSVGAVPTALASFLPAGLKNLQTRFPELRIELHNGGSAVLAEQVGTGELDIAVCTRPLNPIPGLDWHPIATEPFVVVAPVHAKGATWRDLLEDYPFIWFNRKTWAGQSIEQELREKQVKIKATMEIDTLEAIANLVGEGLGVSILPVCKGKRPFSRRLRHVPFGDPPYSREVGAFTGPGGRADLVIDACVTAMIAV